MAMTPQQARAKALQLRSLKPELQNMAVDDLIAQIMASDGMGAPGAGAGGLADLFPIKLTAASPAPVRAARLEAPKPTAQIVPASGNALPDQVRQTAQARVNEPPAAEVAAPVRAAAPEVAPQAAPKPKSVSRFRPQFEQAKAELEQLKATVPAGVPTPPELASKLRNLSSVVSRLQGMVAAEEGAVVDADRAALLERQTARLGREEELVERARKRAPFDALIAGGAALASAKPGESFTSALARGLAAGSESYTGARDAREASLRGIEEKRDAYTLQKIDALQSARDKAIELANAGVQLTKEEYALAGLEDADIVNLGTQQARIEEAGAKASKAKTEAQYAPKLLDADLALTRARTTDALRPPSSGGSGGSSDGTGGGPLSTAQATARGAAAKTDLTRLEKQILASDEAGNHAQTEQLLNQYKSTRDAFNRIAAVAGRAPITVRGFPAKLPRYEAYVKKKGRHPSGRTSDQYGAYEAANKYVPS
jgi:hypothetical protein